MLYNFHGKSVSNGEPHGVSKTFLGKYHTLVWGKSSIQHAPKSRQVLKRVFAPAPNTHMILQPFTHYHFFFSLMKCAYAKLPATLSCYNKTNRKHKENHIQWFSFLKGVLWSIGKGSEIFRENSHLFDFHLKAYYVCIAIWKLFTWNVLSICRIWS